MPETVINKWFNPASLRWARKRMGLNPQEVEDLSKQLDILIKSKDLIAWENDQDEPELNELEMLATIYACPVGYFTQDSPEIEDVPLNYRGLSASKIDSLSYESRLQIRRFTSLYQYLDFITAQLNHRQFHINHYSLDDNIEAIATAERNILGITLEARQQMTSPQTLFQTSRQTLENLGIFILSLKLNPKEIRGASLWVLQGSPSILVNDADAEAAAGRTFTLLHEYAHLLIGEAGIICDFRGQDEKIETFCNKFAAEMLVPKVAFRQYLEVEGLLEEKQWWPDYSLDKIRRPFLASRDVVAILLEEIGLAPEGFYLRKASIWDSQKTFFKRSKLGAHRRTKLEMMRNKLGNAYTSAIITGYDRGIVSSYDLAELLDSRIEKVDEFVKWARKS